MILGLIFACFLISLIFSLFSFIRYANYWKKRGVKGPTPLPIIGNSLDILLKSSFEIEEERFKKYGRVYGTLLGPTPVITIGEPELIKLVTVKDFHNFRNKAPLLPNDPVLSFILDDLNDDDWKRVRSIVTPAFSSGKMKRMSPLISKSVDNAIEYLKEVCDKEEIYLKKFSIAFGVEMISKCVLGLEMDVFKEPNGELLKNALKVGQYSLSRIFLSSFLPVSILKILKIQQFSNDVRDYFVEMVRQVFEQRKQMKTKHTDIMGLLLEAYENGDNMNGGVKNDSNHENTNGVNKKVNENEILANLFLFFVAGYVAISIFLNFFLYSMAVESETQEKLFVEIREYFKRNKGELNFEDLLSLPYLDAVINETLRLYTPEIDLRRLSKNDYVLGDTGITVPKGTVVTIPISALQRDPSLFPSPNEFKAERFLPENKDQILPYTYSPFGVGPRNCAGMRFAIPALKIFIAKLLNEFEIRKTMRTPPKPIFNSITFELSSKPLYASFIRRKDE